MGLEMTLGQKYDLSNAPAEELAKQRRALTPTFDKEQRQQQQQQSRAAPWLDANGNGVLDDKEITELIKLQLEREPTTAEVEQFLKEVDVDRGDRLY